MKIAIFLPNWIGDVVMATPTLRAVRDHYPSAEIVGVLRPYVADVLEGSGLLDRTLFYHPRGKQADQRGLTFVRMLRAERFDVALLLPNSLRSGALAWISGAKRRVGFARDLRGMLLTDPVAPKSKSTPHPVLDEYLRLAEKLGCRQFDRAMQLGVTEADQGKLDQFWESRKARLGTDDASNPRAYVCLNTGGAFGTAKNWPAEHFAELARKIAVELGRFVLVVCGPSERDDARRIAEIANHTRVDSLANETLSIGLTKAAIRGADLLVTTDSGPRHFAAAFDTPVVSLFGPTHIAWSENHFEKAEHLQLKLYCGPCQQRECPLKHHRCMKELSVESVFTAVQRQLNNCSSGRKAA